MAAVFNIVLIIYIPIYYHPKYVPIKFVSQEFAMTTAIRGAALRNDWQRAEVEALFALPFNDLLFQAHSVHRQFFDPNAVQVSTLLSIKTGACPEDCKYCPQSNRYDTGLEPEKLMEVQKVLE